MNESAYSTLLKHVENTEYTENLTENEKRKLRKQAKHYVSKDTVTAAFSLSHSVTFLVSSYCSDSR
jgi:hypothetical protein